MPRVVISEFMDDGAVARLVAAHDTLYDPGLVDRPADLARALGGAQALIVRNRTQVNAGLLDGATGLRCVGRLGVGLDNIDMPACAARGIAVFLATGANDQAVAEYVITTSMMLLRGAYGATARVVAGHWPRQALMGRETAGRTLGLIGHGAIARRTAALARGLGMACIGHDPFLPDDSPNWDETLPRSLPALLAEADVISLHVPLTDATRAMIGPAQLAALRPGAIVINAARGGVVDEGAVISALRSGHLGGAALDVFESEPLDAVTGSAFADLPNLILTPHIAGVTTESNVRVSDLIADRVLAHLEASE